MNIKFSELYTVIWAKAIFANVMKSWTMWTGYVYILAGAMYDYMPAFRSVLGRHYNIVFMMSGALLILLRLKTKKPIVMPKEQAVEQHIEKQIRKEEVKP